MPLPWMRWPSRSRPCGHRRVSPAAETRENAGGGGISLPRFALTGARGGDWKEDEMESGGDAGNWERMAGEYGDDWAAAVRALDATTQRVAVAAAERHRANLSEDIATGQIVTDFTGPTRGERPHA